MNRSQMLVSIFGPRMSIQDFHPDSMIPYYVNKHSLAFLQSLGLQIKGKN